MRGKWGNDRNESASVFGSERVALPPKIFLTSIEWEITVETRILRTIEHRISLEQHVYSMLVVIELILSVICAL